LARAQARIGITVGDAGFGRARQKIVRSTRSTASTFGRGSWRAFASELRMGVLEGFDERDVSSLFAYI
jgi:hypothetical protein